MNDIPINNIIEYKYNITCEKSFSLTDEEIEKYTLNEKLKSLAPFDIIIVDGPEGYNNKKPGRLIPCYWATLLSKQGTIIYIDDANRPLENYCINKYFSNNKKQIFTERDKCIKIFV